MAAPTPELKPALKKPKEAKEEKKSRPQKPAAPPVEDTPSRAAKEDAHAEKVAQVVAVEEKVRLFRSVAISSILYYEQNSKGKSCIVK